MTDPDLVFRLDHPPLRPRVEYFGRPVEIRWCQDCERYFHQEHRCADWSRS